MSKAKHISFEQLAGNLADLLNQVRAEHTSIIVEYPSGEKVLIKPYAPTPRRARTRATSGADNRAWVPQPNQEPDGANVSSNVSSMGAVFDLDPDSITPG